jgi:hypothetical protein
LVALDRQAFAARASELGRRRTADLSRALEDATSAESDGRHLEVLSALAQARCVALEGEKQWEISRLVAPAVPTPAPSHSAREIAARADRAVSRVRIVARIDSIGRAARDEPAVVEAVLNAITRLRINVSDTADNPHDDGLTLILEGRVSAEEASEIAPGLHVARAITRFDLKGPDGRVLFSVSKSDKCGGQGKLRAQVRALKQLAPAAADAVVKAIGRTFGLPTGTSGCGEDSGTSLR